MEQGGICLDRIDRQARSVIVVADFIIWCPAHFVPACRLRSGSCADAGLQGRTVRLALIGHLVDVADTMREVLISAQLRTNFTGTGPPSNAVLPARVLLNRTEALASGPTPCECLARHSS